MKEYIFYRNIYVGICTPTRKSTGTLAELGNSLKKATIHSSLWHHKNAK